MPPDTRQPIVDLLCDVLVIGPLALAEVYASSPRRFLEDEQKDLRLCAPWALCQDRTPRDVARAVRRSLALDPEPAADVDLLLGRLGSATGRVMPMLQPPLLRVSARHIEASLSRPGTGRRGRGQPASLAQDAWKRGLLSATEEDIASIERALRHHRAAARGEQRIGIELDTAHLARLSLETAAIARAALAEPPRYGSAVTITWLARQIGNLKQGQAA